MRWVKAHQDPQHLVGEARILAIFNARVDAEAKKVVAERAQHRLYRALFKEYNTAKEDAARLADLHVAIAQAFVEVERPKIGEWAPDGLVVVGRGTRLDEISLRSQVHSGFGRRLHPEVVSIMCRRLVWDFSTRIALAICLRHGFASSVLVRW